MASMWNTPRVYFPGGFASLNLIGRPQCFHLLLHGDRTTVSTLRLVAMTTIDTVEPATALPSRLQITCAATELAYGATVIPAAGEQLQSGSLAPAGWASQTQCVY